MPARLVKEGVEGREVRKMLGPSIWEKAESSTKVDAGVSGWRLEVWVVRGMTLLGRRCARTAKRKKVRRNVGRSVANKSCQVLEIRRMRRPSSMRQSKVLCGLSLVGGLVPVLVLGC